MKKSIAIITTKQNYNWLSMREVIPAIEECWKESTSSYRLINVDCEHLRDHIHFLMKCDVFVIIAFNETISRFIVNVRQNLGLQIPIVFHLYGHATIALWPEYRFKTLSCLTTGDIFVGTCEGDVKCMQVTLENANTIIIPYPYFPLNNNQKPIKGKKAFAYVGRISDQKNIDLLIIAYKEFLRTSHERVPLLIFGKEDHLGSPNMGIKSTECLSVLQKLVAKEDLLDDVVFLGYKTRDEIYSILGTDHIFVSASTHSDENFGMAAMRSLANGGKAILSDWGGHKIFKKYFSNRTSLIKVDFDNNGRPMISPQEFAEAMVRCIQNDIDTSTLQLPKYFSPQAVTAQFIDTLNKIEYSSIPLIATDLANEVFLQQEKFESQGDIQKVFYGYNDPRARQFLQAYT